MAEMREIQPGVWLLEYSRFSSLTYLLKGEGEAWLVDPGCGEPEELREGLQQAGLKPEQVTRVFLTHSHYDHVANTGLLANAIVHASSQTLHRLRTNDPHTLLQEAGVKFEAKNKQQALGDGETVGNGELELICFHTPGHVQDSVVYYAPKQKVLFSGDTLFTAPGLPRLFEEPQWGPAELAQSLRKLIRLDAKVLAPGHPPLSDNFKLELRVAIQALER